MNGVKTKIKEMSKWVCNECKEEDPVCHHCKQDYDNDEEIICDFTEHYHTYCYEEISKKQKLTQLRG